MPRDDPNGQIHVIRRSDGEVVGSFGRVGRGPGEFENLHNIAIVLAVFPNAPSQPSPSADEYLCLLLNLP